MGNNVATPVPNNLGQPLSSPQQQLQQQQQQQLNIISAPGVPVMEEEIITKCSLEDMLRNFFKDYVILWHDPNVNSPENQQYIGHIRRYCVVQTFTDWVEASAYIKGTNAICHVITAGTNGEILVKDISPRDNVHCAYVFCGNKEYHSSWAKNYPKVACVETHLSPVLQRIHMNLLQRYEQGSCLGLNIPAFSHYSEDCDEVDLHHLHHYLKTIPNFKNRLQAKYDFLNLSKSLYMDPSNASVVMGFEQNYHDYNKNEILRWYVQEFFLYKVINNCLKVASNDSLQYGRFILSDLEKAIREQYNEKSKNFTGLLYRGANISQQEWASLKKNLGQEIEMHGFLLASKEKKAAMSYMQNDPDQKVMITILVPKGPLGESQGFAEIEEFSRFPNEREVLFNLSSRFTILEAEDGEYLPFRHLVLLYGAQSFRRFVTQANPVKDIPIPFNVEQVACFNCKNAISNQSANNLFFMVLRDGENPPCFCEKCLPAIAQHYNAPLLCGLVKAEVGTPKVLTVKMKGFMPTYPMKTELHIPFYGYTCRRCQKKRQAFYLKCTECSETCCQSCMGDLKNCVKIGHAVFAESNPFSVWSQKLSLSQQNKQEKPSELELSEMYLLSKQYERVIEYCNLYLQRNGNKGPDAKLATCFNDLGAAYVGNKDYEKALEYYLKSLQIRQALYGNNHEDVATCLHHMGMVYYSTEKNKEAIDSCGRALEIRRQIYGENHVKTAQVYHSLARIYEQKGEIQKSLEYNLKTLGIRKLVLGENHKVVGYSYNNIGVNYKEMKQYEKAIEFYTKFLDVQTKVFGDTHEEVAFAYSNIGDAHEKNENDEKALECYLKALAIRQIVFGNSSKETSFSLDNIASVYLNLSDYDKALEYYFKTLDLKRLLYGVNHLEVGYPYENIGIVYRNSQQYEKALEYYFKALEMYSNPANGTNHTEIANCVYNIGYVYERMKEYEKAIEYFSKSLEIRRTKLQEKDEETANCYHALGLSYKELKDSEKLIENLLKAIEIRKSLFGENDAINGDLYYELGLAYALLVVDIEDFKPCLEYYLKSLEINKSIVGDNHDDRTAHLWFNIGMINFGLGEIDKALEYLPKGFELRKSLSGESSSDTIECCRWLAQLYEHTDVKKAIEYHLKLVEMKKSLEEGENTEEIADVYSKIAGLYLEEKQDEEALKIFVKGLEVCKAVFGENDKKTAACYDGIGRILFGKNIDDDALEYSSKALEIYKTIADEEDEPKREALSTRIEELKERIKKAQPEKPSEEDIEALAAFYFAAGCQFEKQGQLQMALDVHARCLDIREAIYGLNAKVTEESYNRIAEICFNGGNHAKSIEYYLKSLKVKKSLCGEKSKEVGDLYRKLGQLHCIIKEYEKAIEYGLTTLEIRKAIYGSKHEETVDCYEDLGLYYLGDNKKEQALEYLFKSLESRKLLFGENHEEIASSYNSIALIYDKMGDPAKTIEFYLKGLAVHKTLYGEKHEKTATSYDDLAQVCDKIDPEKALVFFLKALEVYEGLACQKYDVKKARLCARIAEIFLDRKQFDNANEFQKKYLDIKKSHFGDNHEEVASSYEAIGLAYEKYEEKERAIEYFSQCVQILKSLHGDKHPKVQEILTRIHNLSNKTAQQDKSFESKIQSLLQAELNSGLFGQIASQPQSQQQSASQNPQDDLAKWKNLLKK